MQLPRLPHALPIGPSGRVLALCILGAVLTVFMMGIVLPLVTAWNDLDDQFQALTVRASGYDRLVARQDTIAAQLTALRERLAEASDYLVVAEPAVAAAETQGKLSALATDSGALVRSTLTLQPTVADGFTAIGFQLSVSGSMLAVRDLLYAIESGQPRLIIDRLMIVPSQQQGAAPGDLDVSLDLHGYMPGEVEP